MIIGFSGRAGAGKDTAVGVLEEMLGQTLDKYKLTDPIKRFCREVMNWDEEYTDGAYKEIVTELGFSPRQMMQKLGTDFGRSLYPDIWIDHLMCKIRAKHTLVPRSHEDWIKHHFVTVSDVRFVNEAKAILNVGGVIVYLEGGGLPGQEAVHASEYAVEHVKPFADIVIDNQHRDIGALRGSIKNMIRQLPVLACRK